MNGAPARAGPYNQTFLSDSDERVFLCLESKLKPSAFGGSITVLD